MSEQILLQGKILGIEEFLLSPPGGAMPARSNGEELLAGRSQWITLLCEVLPRALLADLNPGHRGVPSVPARRSNARAVEWRGASRRAFAMDHVAVRGPAAGPARRIRARSHSARFERRRTVPAGATR